MTGFDRLGGEIAREQDALRARTSHRADVRATLDMLEVREPSPRRTRALRIAGAAAVAALAAAGWFVIANRPASAPLVAIAESSGATVAAGAWLEAQGSTPFALRFSDGSRVEIAAHSRARLVDMDADGAHLLLESGRARLQVTHRPHARWRVSAGPFAVHVIGTRFEVQWNPEQDQFVLDLTQGAVDVAGCAFEQGYRMHAGQRLEASCKHEHFDVSEGARSEAAATPVATAPAAFEVAPAYPARPAAAAQQPLATTADHDARPQVAGLADTRAPTPGFGVRAARVHRAARRSAVGEKLGSLSGSHGVDDLAPRALPSDFEARCANAPADELVALADAAHYAREQDREAYAWRLLRRRFPGTPRAGLAGFALGRLEFDAHGSYAKAAEWFGTYLKEQPGGALVREARGRLMEAMLRGGDTRGARALAAAYLREYPSGPHADLARSLEQMPSP
jgi:hypothetical protein